MSYVTELCALPRRNVFGWPKQTRKQKVKEIDERRLAAKIEQQRLRLAARREQTLRHLSKDGDIGAAETVDRLFLIADDEEVRAGVFQSQLLEQLALQRVRILKLINQK